MKAWAQVIALATLPQMATGCSAEMRASAISHALEGAGVQDATIQLGGLVDYCGRGHVYAGRFEAKGRRGGGVVCCNVNDVCDVRWIG